jgi:hypothetical protein
MNPLDRLVGESLRINERRYKISGFNVAEREVVVRAVALDQRHEQVQLTLPQVLEGLFRDKP